MKDKVEKALDKIRPMLRGDGGDVQLISVDEATGVVKVRLTGACGCCPHATMTLKALVERQLKADIPEVKQVLSA